MVWPKNSDDFVKGVLDQELVLFKEAQKCQVWDAVMLWHPSMKTAPAAGALYKLSRLKSVALACKIPCAVSSPIEHALQGIQ